MGWGGGTDELAGPSMSVSVCNDLSQCGGLSSWRQSKLLPAEAGMPGKGGGRKTVSDDKTHYTTSSTQQHSSCTDVAVFLLPTSFFLSK